MNAGSSRVRALVGVFCLTFVVLAACKVTERLDIGQWPGAAAVLLTSAVGVWLWPRAAHSKSGGPDKVNLAGALDQAEEAVVITDAEGRIQYVNAAFSRVTGYTAVEAIGQNPRLLKSGSQDPRFYQDLWRTIGAGKTWRGLLTNRRKDGSLYTEEMNITPVRDGGGAITGYIAIKQDVTLRRAAEAARDFLASIVEATSDAMVGRDLDGVVMSWNHGAEAMYGYPAEEIIGRPVTVLVPPEKHDYVRERAEKLRRGENIPEFESVGLRKDGTRIATLLTLSAIRDSSGRVVAAASLVRDITERKRAEAARALLASIVDSTDDAIFSNTLDGTIVSWNRGAESLYGYRAGDIVGQPITRLAAADRFNETAQVLGRINHGERVSQLETVTVGADGRQIDVSLTVSPIRNTAGEVTGAATIARDISLRKRIEAERMLLASIVESSDDAIITRALDGTITSWNKGAESIYGYRADEVLGKDITILVPGRVSELPELHKGVMQEICRLETTRLKADGACVPVSLTVCPIRNAVGELVGTAGIARDISARQRAEQALRQSEEKYRSLVANIPDVIWTADADGRAVFVSCNCERMYGYTQEEACQGVWFEHIHREDAPRVMEAYQALFTRGQSYSVELRMQRKDGSWIWVHDRATSSYEKDGKRYTDGIISDITERKQAFELVASLQRRNELILDSAGEGILGLDAGAKVTFANAAATRMLGLSSAELVGRSMHDLVRHTRPDDTNCSPEDCAIVASIRNGMERHATNDMFWGGGGKSFPVEFTRTPQVEDGRAAGAVVVFRDITEAKLAQERVQASLKEKEALLREIHHRVKNNLQVVCSLLNLQSRSLEDVQAKRVFEGTRHRVKAMALVHETLYQSGDLAGIDFSAYAARLVPQLMHAYGLAPERVRVCLEVQSAILPIDTAIPCALMLTELVSNSLKHAMGAAREGELRIGFRRLEEPSWLLEVQNPAGAQAVESGPHQGASFGLQLVRLLTEQLNGTVHIERGPDFKVSVMFPVADRSEEN